MSTDNAQKFRDAWVAFWGPDMSAAANSLCDAMLNQEFHVVSSQPLDASINTASTHTLDQNTGVTMLAKTFKVIVGTNVTADNTNNATIALVYNNGAGGSDTTVATINTAASAAGGTGNITAGTAYALTINATNARIPAGSQIQVKVTKSGAGGLALPFTSFDFKAAPSA